MDVVFVDSSIVSLHRHGGGALKKKGDQAIGRGRRGVEHNYAQAISSDSIIACKLFPAQRQDCKGFEELEQVLPWGKIKYLVADKGYDTLNVRNTIKSYGATPVIPF